MQRISKLCMRGLAVKMEGVLLSPRQALCSCRIKGDGSLASDHRTRLLPNLSSAISRLSHPLPSLTPASSRRRQLSTSASC